MLILEWMHTVPIIYNGISEAKPKCNNDSIIRHTHQQDYLSAALMQRKARCIQSCHVELSAISHCAPCHLYNDIKGDKAGADGTNGIQEQKSHPQHVAE